MRKPTLYYIFLDMNVFVYKKLVFNLFTTIDHYHFNHSYRMSLYGTHTISCMIQKDHLWNASHKERTFVSQEFIQHIFNYMCNIIYGNLKKMTILMLNLFSKQNVELTTPILQYITLSIYTLRVCTSIKYFCFEFKSIKYFVD